MPENPSSQFGKRKPSVPSGPKPTTPAKRSHEVVLLLMGTLAVGSAAYSLMPRECTPPEPGTIPTVSSPSECPPRGSSSSSRGGGHYGYSSGGSSGSTTATGTDAESGHVRRGGFGSSAHSFSSHFSFGS